MTGIPDTTVYEQCGRQMESRQEGSTHGLYCTRCDWSIVATYIPEITLDTTSYEVQSIEPSHDRLSSVANPLNPLATRSILPRWPMPLA